MQEKLPFALASFLTWIAGFVDAVGYLSLQHIYTANMSGNSVAIGIQFASQNWQETAKRFLPVVGYVIGLLFCRILIGLGARKRIRTIASVSWMCEIALLVPACMSSAGDGRSWPVASIVYIGLLAAAMGIQNATLTHFSSLTINTGFVTGTLVKFAEQATKYLSWLYDRVSSGTGIGRSLAESARQKHFRATVWLALIWLAYIAGASCGALSDYRFMLRALAAPIGALVVLIAIDLRNPLGIIEEQAQAAHPA